MKECQNRNGPYVYPVFSLSFWYFFETDHSPRRPCRPYCHKLYYWTVNFSYDYLFVLWCIWRHQDHTGGCRPNRESGVRSSTSLPSSSLPQTPVCYSYSFCGQRHQQASDSALDLIFTWPTGLIFWRPGRPFPSSSSCTFSYDATVLCQIFLATDWFAPAIAAFI